MVCLALRWQTRDLEDRSMIELTIKICSKLSKLRSQMRLPKWNRRLRISTVIPPLILLWSANTNHSSWKSGSTKESLLITTWLLTNIEVTQSQMISKHFSTISKSKMISKGLIWMTCSLRRKIWRMLFKAMRLKSKTSISRMKPVLMISTQNRETSTRSSRKKMPNSLVKLITRELSSRMSALDWFNPKHVLGLTTWDKELNISRTRELFSSKRKTIWNFKQTRWTCHCQKLEKDYRIESRKTILSWRAWIRSTLRLGRWSRLMLKMSKKSTMIWKRNLEVRIKEMSKSMKFYIRKKRRLMNSLNNSSWKRPSTRKKSVKVNTW